MFSAYTTPKELRNATIAGHFEFVFEKTRWEKWYDYREAIVFEKLRFLNVSVHLKMESLRFQTPPV